MKSQPDLIFLIVLFALPSLVLIALGIIGFHLASISKSLRIIAEIERRHDTTFQNPVREESVV